MSYHYAPPADYIKIRNADSLARLFSDKGHPYVEGRVWTTDAIYRETRGQVEQRKQEGCLVDYQTVKTSTWRRKSDFAKIIYN